jgi:SAM-dependent methyltransferase
MKEGRSAASYGDGCADFYDEIYGPADRHLIATLYALAGNGPVLELGVGTGRVALLLAALGVSVYGVEASDAMISKLREKPGGDRITVIPGNFATLQPAESFSLIFALVNTFFLLRSRSEQRQCFKTVAAILSGDGAFLIEAFKPVGAQLVGNNESQDVIHVLEQVIHTRKGLQRYRSELCYLDASALDEMARESGLRLAERWGNWQHHRCPDNAPVHISVYVR